MKSIHALILCAVLGAALPAKSATVFFPNGDFSTPAGVSWAQVSGGITYSYPASGGNPGGYGVMDATNGQWAIWISNGDVPVTLSSLGLTAGKAYSFKQDMITLLPGTGNKAGVKIESWSDTGLLSDSGDMQAATESASWATYSFNYTINPAATRLKLVPLWGANRSVGYDNFRVENVPIVPPPIVPVIANGDFEITGGASWAFFQGGGQTVSYPATGGNPNGCAVIDSVGKSAYAVLVANNNVPVSLASLGLTAGQTYTFTQDMKILAGTNIGGLKVEFVPTSTGDLYPALIGDGTQWATYSFQVTIPPGCTQIQVVPLWGPDSKVAYDNIRIQLPVSAPFAATIEPGKIVSWTPTVAANSYQPQSSPDNVNWVNLGAPFKGTAASSLFQAIPESYYRVEEGAPMTVETLLNGGFETEGNAGSPQSWNLVQSQPPAWNADAHTGAHSVRIAVNNALPGPPANGSEIQQNIAGVGGTPIIAGNTYSFSFWAKQISTGISYEQRYKISWLDSSGGIKGDGGFRNFSGAIGQWELKTQTGLVAPAGAATALIQILGVTGAVANDSGAVLIDDVSLTTEGTLASNLLNATVAAGTRISWPSVNGVTYQVKSSSDLKTWSNFGSAVTGNGSVKSALDTFAAPKKFYQVIQAP